ncbi:MAG: dihydroorotate dehydrogenase [Nitrososphaerota archaeon]|nr:dihydroorotate dehydrogenase [Nitrososphaerota archaeon]
MEGNLRVQLAGLTFSYPCMLASGVLGYSAETMQRVIEAGAGAVVSKSVGLKARDGYTNPTVFQAKNGLINAMGLPNPGIETYVKEIRHVKELICQPLIVSIFGYSAEDYAIVAEKAATAGADALELNVSCPHVKQTGAEIGQNPNVLSEVVKAVKAAVNIPVFVKLSPNVTDITLLANAAVNAGADALTAVNTLKAIAIDIETTKPVLSNIKGGLSGPAMKNIALRCVYDLKEKLLNTPIIGCGGVSNWQDAIEFFLAGANAIQIGTAIAYEGPEVFQTINLGIKKYLEKKQFRSIEEIVGLSHRR